MCCPLLMELNTRAVTFAAVIWHEWFFSVHRGLRAYKFKYCAVIHKMCSDNLRLCSDKGLFLQWQKYDDGDGKRNGVRIPQRRHVELVANYETGNMYLKKNDRVCISRSLCHSDACPVRDYSATVVPRQEEISGAATAGGLSEFE